MSDDTPITRAERKVRLVAFLLPHLKGYEVERQSAVNAVLMTLDTAHAEGIRHAARFCGTVGTGARQHGEAAKAGDPHSCGGEGCALPGRIATGAAGVEIADPPGPNLRDGSQLSAGVRMVQRIGSSGSAQGI